MPSARRSLMKAEYNRFKQQFDVPEEAFEPPFEITSR